MKKEFTTKINDLFGCEPIEINSALVSAQNRKRLYWTNIPGVTQPKDKDIQLKDIVAWSRSTRYPIDSTSYVEERYRSNGKANTLITSEGCGSFSSKNFFAATTGNKKRIVRATRNKSNCLTASYFKGVRASSRPGIATSTLDIGRPFDDTKTFRMLTPEECEFLQTLPRGYTEGISKTQRYKCIGNGWTVDVIAHILKHIRGGK